MDHEQQQPLPKRTNGTEEMTSVCFPQNQMYSSGDKFRSVSQTAPLHLILSDVLSLLVGVKVQRVLIPKRKDGSFVRTFKHERTTVKKQTAATSRVNVLLSLDN